MAGCQPGHLATLGRLRRLIPAARLGAHGGAIAGAIRPRDRRLKRADRVVRQGRGLRCQDVERPRPVGRRCSQEAPAHREQRQEQRGTGLR